MRWAILNVLQLKNESLPAVVSALLVGLIILVPFNWPDNEIALVYIGFAINGAMAAFHFVNHSRAYSMALMYWLFQLLFLSVIPAFQFRFQTFPWDLPVVPTYMVYTNALILFCSILFWWIVHQKQSQPRISSEPMNIEFHGARFHKVGFILFIACAITLIVIIGLPNMWHRARLEQSALRYEQSWFLLVTGFCRAWMTIYFLMSIYLLRLKTVSLFRVICIAVIMFITHFPLALNRNLAGMVWGSAALIFLPVLFQRRKYLFRGITILGLTIAYPLFNLFRFNATKRVAYNSNWETIAASSFAGGDFDAYINITHTIRAVSEHGLSLGWQLLSAILFFVPRSIWPTKGIGSGAYVYGLLQSDKFNVSNPLIAEGYINFGWMGSLIFISFFAFVVKAYDHWYWHHLGTKLTLGKIFYPVIVFGTLNFLRGDLLSNLALLLSFLTILFIMHKVFFRHVFKMKKV